MLSERIRRTRSSMAAPPVRSRTCPPTDGTDAFRSGWHRVWHSDRRSPVPRRQRRRSHTSAAAMSRRPPATAVRCTPSPERRTHDGMMDAVRCRSPHTLAGARLRRTTPDDRPPMVMHTPRSAAVGRERVAAGEKLTAVRYV